MLNIQSKAQKGARPNSLIFLLYIFFSSFLHMPNIRPCCCCLTCAAMTLCLSWMRLHFGQSHSLNWQDLLCPFSQEMRPWLRHLAHLGFLPPSLCGREDMLLTTGGGWGGGTREGRGRGWRGAAIGQGVPPGGEMGRGPLTFVCNCWR